MGNLIDVKDLYLRFTGDRTIHALNGISFKLEEGEILGLLGESGSGKSVLLRTLMRLLPARKTQITGSVAIAGSDILKMKKDELRKLRGGVVSMIFQEPGLAFDPVYTIGDQIAETVMHHQGASKKDALARALEVLDIVRIPAAAQRLVAFPHELSGGMRQRAMIAMALACRPKILLADEPTTALDTTVQIQILLLLRELQKDLGMSIILVTHDTGVTAEICDRVLVMYGGQIVESGGIDEIMTEPRHPYLAGLLGSSVKGASYGDVLSTIPGAPPILDRPPAECSFMPRCAYAIPGCAMQVPAKREVQTGHFVRCLHYENTDRPQALQALTKNTDGMPEAARSGAR